MINILDFLAVFHWSEKFGVRKWSIQWPWFSKKWFQLPKHRILDYVIGCDFL